MHLRGLGRCCFAGSFAAVDLDVVLLMDLVFRCVPVENKIVAEITREAIEIVVGVYIYQRSVGTLILTPEISFL